VGYVLINSKKIFLTTGKQKAQETISAYKITSIIGMILAIIGILGHFAPVEFISEYSFMLLMAGFIALGTSPKGI